MNPAEPTPLPIEPIVGTLRVVSGMRLEDACPLAAALTPPPRAARGREGEHLFILLDLTGPASPHLYRQLRDVVAQTYWSTSGSITAALRQAVAAANRHLFQTNLHTAPSDRCYGGLTCAVLHGNDLFILQAGPTWACVLRGEHLACFPRGDEPPPLGIGPLADVRLYHIFVALGDTLLLAPPSLVQEAGDVGLARVLPRAEMKEVLAGLEQVGAGADFAALVVRWALPGEAPAVSEIEAPQPLPRPRREPPRPEPRPRPKPGRKPGPSLGERMKGGLRSMGRGIAAAGAWLGGVMSTLFRRMLPGPEREARRRERAPRPIPEENRAVMMAIAIGIPIVLAIIVALAYLWFGTEARFHSFINQAEEEIALAQAAGPISQGARPHWEAALEHANAAATVRPDDPAATALQAQAQAALDLLDGIVRLTPVQLWDFGPGTLPRQLVIHGQMIFVLDPAGGWVVQLTLNSVGDGVVEQEVAPILVHTGQQIGEGRVGNLVDFVWAGPGGERLSSGLLILEEDGGLVSYDPAWGGEGGAPQLTRSLLGTPPTGNSKAVGTFEGRFYILDTIADQIWRYEPRGDTYPEPPERYFATPPPKGLATARDLAIDGNIYILYAGGTVLKFLRGELQPFDVRGLPGDVSQAVALAVDSDSSSGAVYVADRGNRRVIVLEPDGDFQVQFRAEGAFEELEALAVDEAARRLYVVSGGRLYVASLP
ncbi:MAG TPA: hypothetical protein EYP09_11920 [Anaerolineae bacterium]|nr:hypothetical protein [Anaerolineae bacterium]